MNDPNKEFDGIQQAENKLPPWWTYTFLACVIFAVIYSIYFHGFDNNWSTEKMYSADVAAYEKKFPTKEEIKSLPNGENPLRGKQEAIAKGEKEFKSICAACHGQDAKGVVGPSLVDNEWLHGDYDGAIFNVIMKGVNPPNTKLNKGPMPAHEASLGPEKIYQIMAWIASNNQSLKKEKDK
ncbi:MAG: c-type cytochrome [Leptospiraceae bacterium]|nr:c-type cytochrome [Leptospiraceae bacterium]MCP5500075.1 c-type cytochrome [Leptospiraceae bacterium]